MSTVGEIRVDASIDTAKYSKQAAEVEKRTQDIAETTDRSASKGEKSWVKMGAALGAVAAIAGTVVTKAIDAVTSSIGAAIKRVDVLNNADRTFINMGFSADEAASTMKKLTKSIKGLPTALDDAVGGVQLLAASTNNIAKSEKIYASLNNAILGFGGSSEMVKNAITQLSQAFSNGKIDAQTWNSMINSGLGPALNALARTMGTTTGKLKDNLSTGKISVVDFQDALIKMNKEGGGGLQSFEKIAADSTKGIGTGIENAKTSVVRGVAEIIKALGSTKISGTISNIGDAFESALKVVAGGLVVMQTEVGDFVKNVTPKIQSIFTDMKSGNFEGAGETIGKGLRKGIDLSLKGIKIGIDTIKDFFSSIDFVEIGKFIVTKIIPGIAIGLVAGLGSLDIIEDILKPIGKNIVPILLGILSIALAPAKLIGPLIKIFSKIPIVGPLANMFVKGIRGLNEPIRNAFGSLFTNAGKSIGGLMSKMGNVIKTSFDIVMTPLRLLIDNIALTIRLIPTSIVNMFKSFTGLLKTIGDAFVSVFTGIFNGLVTTIKVILEPIAGFFSGIFNGIKSQVGPIISSIGDFFTVLYLRIVSVIESIPSVFLNVFTRARQFIDDIFGNIGSWFSGVFNAAWNGITRAFSGVGSFFAGIWNSITSTFTNAGVAIGNAVGGAFKSAINGVLKTAVNIINGFIDSINGAVSVINKIPKVNIPTVGRLGVPMLAEGGIVSSATLAVIGEGREPEAVIPLSKLDAMMNGNGGGSSNSQTTINLNLSGIMARSQSDLKEIGKDIIAAVNQELGANRKPLIGGGNL